MKFITEEDLRDLYKKEPFTSYEPQEGVRLTPGARQFLADRRICMFDEGTYKQKNTVPKEQTEQSQDKPKDKVESPWRMKKILCKFQSVEALFLMTCQEMLEKDVILAQKLLDLCRQFTILKKSVGQTVPHIAVICQECTGIKEGNFCEDLGDCFEITPFHIQLEKGREILILHRLRCSLRELEPVIYENSTEEEWNKIVIEDVNKVVNNLSHMICTAVGGKECQRKI